MTNSLLIVFLIISSILYSCRPKQKSQIRNFGYDIPIKHTVRNPEIMTLMPEGFFRMDSLLVTYAPRLGTTDFGRLISTQSFQEVGKFGSRGRGPLEVIWGFPLHYKNGGNNSTFKAYDLASRSILSYTLQQQGDTLTMQAHDKRQVDQGDNPMQNNLNICQLDSNHYIGLCFHSHDSIFSLINKDLQQIGYFGNSPIPEQIGNAQDRLQGWLAGSYGIAVYAPMELPYIGCYGMQDGKPVKLWEDTFAEMIYQVHGGALVFNRKATWGRTENLKIGKKYIYLLWYNDRLFQYYNRPNDQSAPGADLIFIYDHTGNRIARLKTDIKLSDIEISEDERTLYGLTTPDYALVTFELPEKYPTE